MNHTKSLEQKIRFLTCFDSRNIPYSSDWVVNLNPMDAAQHCAEALDMDWASIATCGGNYTDGVAGAGGLELAKEAATYFLTTFPLFNGTVSPRFQVPHVFINGVDQPLENLEDAWNVTATLCDSGAAAAVCASIKDVQPLKPIWTGQPRAKDALVV